MIGILAGMGPKSTAPFVDKVVSLCQEKYGAQNDMDFPPMMIYSCPTPFSLNQSLDHARMRDAIVAGAQRLAATGVNFLAIPCNTAHLYFADIQQSVAAPVLNMVQETVRRLPSSCRTVALLATPGTIQSGIYQSALETSGIVCVCDDQWQDSVQRILALIKTGGDLDHARHCWSGLLNQLAAEVDAAVIACTDLNVVHDGATRTLICIDSSACLAEAVVDKYYLRLRK